MSAAADQIAAVLTFEVSAPGWISTRPIEELEAFNSDPVAFVSNRLGIGRGDYERYILTAGAVRCSALTKSGHRCRVVLGSHPSRWLVAPARWVQLENGWLCQCHGGSGHWAAAAE
jgi:hypothetical protein